MSGAAIVGALLRADADLTAVVVIESIKAGRLPDDAPLPALLVRTISAVEKHMLKRRGHERVTARIAVTVRAASYRQQEQVIRLVRACCAGRTGDIGGSTRVSILTAGLSPDLVGPGDTFEQTQDLKVSFDAQV